MAGHMNFASRTKIRIQQYLALRKLGMSPRDEKDELISWLTTMCNMLDLNSTRQMLNYLYMEVRPNEDALIVLNDPNITEHIAIRQRR